MNHLYYGDNLVLRTHVASGSVDLIYLDPPFNSNASYNVLFKGPKGCESPTQNKKMPREEAPGLQGKLEL